MAMCYRNNDIYKNESKSAEVHIYDRLSDDFYGSNIDSYWWVYRELSDFPNVEALISQIHSDIQVAKERLATQPPKPW